MMRLNRMAMAAGAVALSAGLMGQMSIEPPAPPPAPTTQETARPPSATKPTTEGESATTAPAASNVLENLLQNNKSGNQEGGGGGTAGGSGEVSQPVTVPPQNPAAAPAVPNVAPHAKKTMRLREGEFIWNRTGHLVRDERTGNWFFEFESDQKGMQDPPMQLLPSKFLAAMEAASTEGTEPVRFKVSGQVTEYKGKNFLWVQHMEIVRDVNKGIGG